MVSNIWQRVGTTQESEAMSRPSSGRIGTSWESVFDTDTQMDRLIQPTRVFHAEAVKVVNERIIANPSNMEIGLGYPVAYKGRQWMVINVDGNRIQYYKGPRI